MQSSQSERVERMFFGVLAVCAVLLLLCGVGGRFFQFAAVAGSCFIAFVLVNILQHIFYATFVKVSSSKSHRVLMLSEL